MDHNSYYGNSVGDMHIVCTCITFRERKVQTSFDMTRHCCTNGTVAEWVSPRGLVSSAD